RTLLTDRATPTPVVSHNVVTRGASSGIIITASHNPAHWNGFKFKPAYGGSASPAIVAELEQEIARTEVAHKVERVPVSQAKDTGLIECFDPRPSYLEHVGSLVDLDAIRGSNLDIVVDPMFGAGAGYFPTLLEGGSARITEMHGHRNPAFPGMAQPEPLGHNLGELASVVGGGIADVGIATDGDADRVGIIDNRGQFITTLKTFALLCFHQLEVLGERGPLVRSITMTRMVDRLGELYSVPVFDTPVGFKYLGPMMMCEDAIIAGEESGGYAFRGNIPERDGILSGLMLLEMLVKTGKSVSELLTMLEEKVGPHHYDRWDLHFDEAERADIENRVCNSNPATLGGKAVTNIDTRDGYQFILEDGHWAVIRFSGTEPLLRIYAEAESPQAVEELLDDARTIAGI
ncbi:MAG: phosphoglucomutase/phosphomannomutase family protein, partial [Dehalococcoidia bacterium]|nr:phosphoglucomutase/phosphomannomutase family protein [Dehalococcoidia bacterium]